MKRGVYILAFMLVFTSFVSASFQVGNQSHSLDKDYGPKDTLRGWINISFSAEPIDSEFSDSLNNKISLKNILTKNPAYTRTCETFNCSEDYNYSLGSQNKTFTLNKNESKILGLVLTGEISDITSAEFTIESSATVSCENQLKIDFIENNYTIKNNKSSSDACETALKNYSCYNPSLDTTIVILDRYSYCQKIRLPEAPGFNVGAWIKRVSPEDADLLLRLFKIGGTQVLAECELDILDGEEGERSCDLDFLVTESQDYYLCLFANTNNEVYQTKRNTAVSAPCGFYGLPQTTSNPISAYHIFAQPKKFNDFGLLKITSKGITGWQTNFTEALKSLIIKRYGDMNCASGCIIPLKITSLQDNQLISLKEPRITYRTNSGVSISNQFYGIANSPARVSAGFQKLFFDQANFTLPTTNKSYDYKMYFKGTKILTDNITIGNIPIIKDINPKTTALGYETKFKASVEAIGANITSYIWSFDGGTKVTTQVNEASHKFESLGIHNITLTIRDTNNKNSTKTFEISVNTPEKQIEKDIKNLKARIVEIKADLGGYNSFDKSVIEEILNLQNAEDVLADVEASYEDAENASEFLEILNSLFSLNIPDTITPSEGASLILFFPQEENINLGLLTSITQETYDESKENSYISSILSWNQENIENKINYKKISSIKNNVQENLVSIFELNINEKNSLDSNPYLIIRNMDNLKFKSNYGQTELDNNYYIELEPGTNIITFSTTEDIDLIDLPVFISPEISKLSIISTRCEIDSDCFEGEFCDEYGLCSEKKGSSKWVIFAISIAVLLVVAFIIYAILFYWYKYKYETYLFSNRNNLFNLVNYINLQKRNGNSEEEIEKKLKKAKWNSEQITYAMKKYSGRNTGMFELPFLKLIFSKNKQGFQSVPVTRPHFGFSQGNLSSRTFKP